MPELSLNAPLQELPLHRDTAELTEVGQVVIELLENHPLLPGVILTREGQYVGMLSRHQFFAWMSRPFGLALYANRPLQLLYEDAHCEPLIYPGHAPIVQVTQEVLRRSPDLIYEPLVVQLQEDHYGLLDVQQLLFAYAQIHELATHLLSEQATAQMLQTAKMASLGRLITEVSHEIANPINFLYGNLEHLNQYSQDLLQVLDTYAAEFPQSSPQLTSLQEEIELDFLVADLPRLLASMQLGAERLKQIVGGLRSFSHVDETYRKPANLHECLDNTLLILNNRIKFGVEVVKQYGAIPEVSCYSGQLSQVFMNLLSNALDALAEKNDAIAAPTGLSPSVAATTATLTHWQPCIEITTELCTHSDFSTDTNPNGKGVVIRIRDNGPGIAPEIQTRIFETFFTTKPVGKGTGLGLAISQQIVTEKHQGKLTLHSQPDQGTAFEIWLPLI